MLAALKIFEDNKIKAHKACISKVYKNKLNQHLERYEDQPLLANIILAEDKQNMQYNINVDIAELF